MVVRGVVRSAVECAASYPSPVACRLSPFARCQRPEGGTARRIAHCALLNPERIANRSGQRSSRAADDGLVACRCPLRSAGGLAPPPPPGGEAGADSGKRTADLAGNWKLGTSLTGNWQLAR